MKKKEQILKAFIEEKLSAQGLVLDDLTLRAILTSVTLEEGTPKEEEETRSVYLKDDTDGKISAKSIKLYNLMNVSYHDLTGFIIKELAILASGDVGFKAFMSILNLLNDFYPKLTYKYNDTDAKILMIVYLQKGKIFTAEEISLAFNKQYEKDISLSQLERSLSFLVARRTLKHLGKGKYTAKERMIYERN